VINDMDSKNRYDRLRKRDTASQQPIVIMPPTEAPVEKSSRWGNKGRRQRMRLFLMGSLVWILLVVAAVVYLSLNARPRPVMGTASRLPVSFAVRVAGSAIQQVDKVKAVWVGRRQQGGDPCDLYEVQGTFVNRKGVGDSIALEVTLEVGGVKYPQTFREQVPPGKGIDFKLPIYDFSFARERRQSIYFVLSVSQ
jgi:hypothetical protein